MTKTALNKSSLNREKQSLKTFNRYLPALELKRQQLMLERKKAKTLITQTKQDIQDIEALIAKQLPMLAFQPVNVEHLVQLKDVHLDYENIVGTAVPTVKKIDLYIKPYHELSKPHWVDYLVQLLQEMVHLRIEHQVREQRYQAIDKATRTTSQRVNLFSKVLIPKTQQHIKKIRIYLSDQDRASVMNAKLSKAKVLINEQKSAQAR